MTDFEKLMKETDSENWESKIENLLAEELHFDGGLDDGAGQFIYWTTQDIIKTGGKEYDNIAAIQKELDEIQKN